MASTPQPASPSASASGAPATPTTVNDAAQVGLDRLLIDRATPEHVPYLQRLKEMVMTERYRPAADEAGFASWRDMYCTDAYFEQLIEAPNTMLLTLGTLREPAGMVVLHRHPDLLEIDDLLVRNPRRGDGTRLLRACMRYAEAWRYHDVIIDIYPGHTTVVDFLAQHGFQHTGDACNDLDRPMHRYTRMI